MAFDLLPGEESNHCEHGNTSVGDFSFAVALEGVWRGLVCKAEGIPEAGRVEGSWKAVDGEDTNRGGHLLLDGRSEGDGRAKLSMLCALDTETKKCMLWTGLFFNSTCQP